MLRGYTDVFSGEFDMSLSTKGPISSNTHHNPLGIWAPASPSGHWDRTNDNGNHKGTPTFSSFDAYTQFILRRSILNSSPFMSVRFSPLTHCNAQVQEKGSRIPFFKVLFTENQFFHKHLLSNFCCYFYTCS